MHKELASVREIVWLTSAETLDRGPKAPAESTRRSGRDGGEDGRTMDFLVCGAKAPGRPDERYADVWSLAEVPAEVPSR